MKSFVHCQQQGMNLGKAVPSRLLASLALAGFVALLGLSLRRPGAVLLRSSYDSPHSLAGLRSEATSDSPVVIVYLDLHPFSKENKTPHSPGRGSCTRNCSGG